MKETLELIPVKFEKVMQARTYTCVVLSSKDKTFAIYSDPSSGKTMQQYLTSKEKPRPLTHDFMNKIFLSLDIKLKHVVINDLEDTIYFARFFLEQKIGDILHIVEIDARPSDCITLALLHKLPIYCTKEVLEKAITYSE